MEDKKTFKGTVKEGDEYFNVFDVVKFGEEVKVFIDGKIVMSPMVEELFDVREKVSYDEIKTAYGLVAQSLKEAVKEYDRLEEEFENAKTVHNDLVDKYDSYEDLINPEDIITVIEDEEEEDED